MRHIRGSAQKESSDGNQSKKKKKGSTCFPSLESHLTLRVLSDFNLSIYPFLGVCCHNLRHGIFGSGEAMLKFRI